jgi:hypothetical protein
VWRIGEEDHVVNETNEEDLKELTPRRQASVGRNAKLRVAWSENNEMVGQMSL